MKKLTFQRTKIKKVLFVLSLAGILAIGGIMAYFTSSETVTNTFTVGKVNISLNEPSYIDAQTLRPGNYADKDPAIENVGKNSAFVFLEVTVPKANVRLYKEPQGNENPYTMSKDKQLFNIMFNEEQYNSEQWTQLTDTEPDLEDNVYLFAYGSATEMTELKIGETTPALFNKVQLIPGIYAWSQKELDAVEYSKKDESEKAAWIENHPMLDEERWNELAAYVTDTSENGAGVNVEEGNYNIDVKAYAIQSSNIGEIAPLEVWQMLKGKIENDQ